MPQSKVKFSHGPPELRSVWVRRALLVLFLIFRVLENNIHSRCLEELRTEFDRLVFLKWQTIAKYGQGNEVREAKETMVRMKGMRSLKEAHRQG